MGLRRDHIIIVTFLIILIGTYAGNVSLAHAGNRGLGYKQALAARSPAGDERVRPTRSAAEKRAIQRWGKATGRWWDECRRYWPASQLPNCMYCIKHESGGNPRAYNSYSGAKGLFQLVGHKCNVWPPLTNIRLAHKLWLNRGWQPWSVM